MFENLFHNPTAEERANKAFAEICRRQEALDKRIGQLSILFSEMQNANNNPININEIIDRKLADAYEHIDQAIEDSYNDLIRILLESLNAKTNGKTVQDTTQQTTPPDMENPSRYTLFGRYASAVCGIPIPTLYHLAVAGHIKYYQKDRYHLLYYNREDLEKLREDRIKEEELLQQSIAAKGRPL